MKDSAGGPNRGREALRNVNVQGEISGFDQEVTGLNSKLADLAPLQKGRESEFEENKTQHDSLQQGFQKKADEFNAGCAGRELLGEVYRSCKAWQERLQQEKNNLKPQLAKMEARAVELQQQYRATANEQTLAETRVQKLTNAPGQL